MWRQEADTDVWLYIWAWKMVLLGKFILPSSVNCQPGWRLILKGQIPEDEESFLIFQKGMNLC